MPHEKKRGSSGPKLERKRSLRRSRRLDVNALQSSIRILAAEPPGAEEPPALPPAANTL